MKAIHITKKYEKGVEHFLGFSQQNSPNVGREYYFSCAKCLNSRWQILNDIKTHLLFDEILQNFTGWI